jgi:hypothetical protein
MQTQETFSKPQPKKEISDKIKPSKHRDLRPTTESVVTSSQRPPKNVPMNVRLHVGSRAMIRSKKENNTDQHTEYSTTTTHTQSHVIHSGDNNIPKECSMVFKTV